MFRRFRKIRTEIETISQCGYLADPPSPFTYRLLRLISRLLVFIHVGEIRIVDRENLNVADGPMLICPNHPHYVDSAILLLLLRKSARCMAHRELFRFAFGLGALFMVRIGGFPARDGKRDDALRACETAAKALSEGEIVVVFPEGSTSFKPALMQLHNGAIHIVRETARRIGGPAYIVPIYIRYGRYPGEWIQRFKAPVQYLFVFFGFWRYRRGVTITVGRPIASSEIPLEKRPALDLLRNRIVSLDSFDKSGAQEDGVKLILT